MYQGRRVVSVTPFGRRRYVKLLAHYLLGLRGVIDEHHFWLNTDRAEDLAFAHALAGAYPDFFKLATDRSRYTADRALVRLCAFWKQCAEPDTLYLRFDDDIVWIAPGAIERLLDFRLAHPHYLVVFPNIVNNSLCSHLHQRMGLLPPRPAVEYECLGDVSWKRWQTARDCHEMFLKLRAAGQLARYRFERWELGRFERFSINVMCWLGRDLIPWARQFHGDEEHWASVVVAERTGRINCVVGDALVAHFAYGPQREALEANTDLLDRYRNLVPPLELDEPASTLPINSRLPAQDPIQHLAEKVAGLFGRRRQAA